MGFPLIQDEELQPGDLVDVEYEITDTVNFLEDAAIASVKRELAKDPRFHYQGSTIVDREEAFGPVKILIITVQVADPSKVTGNNPPGSVVGPDLEEVTGGKAGGTQEAGIDKKVVAKVSQLVMVIAGAVIVYSGALIYKSYVVNRHPVAAAIVAASTGLGLFAVGLAILAFVFWPELRRFLKK